MSFAPFCHMYRSRTNALSIKIATESSSSGAKFISVDTREKHACE